MAYQSLYRRYRPQKFSEIKGQDHVVRALQTAVRTDKVGHAYLLHGPRGSGKTSTARVLAKALNCTDLGDDGEPCCVCESCLSIQQGRSFDLQELDAASNNKVDDMRGLLERVNLTSPGRAKVYLLDEVHMLTAGAENALLKTLEEPPDHVTWVLATTEPHKVVHTIRSRCQVFELGLIGADIMSGHLRHVVDDAGLDVDREAIDHAVAAGGGSVRDSLTALERIVTGGGTTELDSSTDAVLNALADRDRAAALAAVGDAVGRGRDPRTIGEMALAGLRDAFLTAMGDPPPRMSEHERARADDLAARMAPAAITRALETLGRALIDMRQAPDPRIDIEVALMRLIHPDEDRSLEALAQRIRRLEARLDSSPVPAASQAMPSPPPAPAAPAAPAAPPSRASTHRTPPPSERADAPSAAGARPAITGRPADAIRKTLAEHRSAAAARREVAAAAASPAPPPGPDASPPPVPVPGLEEMQPKTPTQVVDWARRHLGLERSFVVARAVDLEPDQQRRREHAQLQALWKDLVAHVTSPTVEADQAGPGSAVQADQVAPGPAVEADQAAPGSAMDAGQAAPGPAMDAGQAGPGPAVQADQAGPGPAMDAGQAGPGPAMDAGQPAPGPAVDAGQAGPGPAMDAGQPAPGPAVQAGQAGLGPVADAVQTEAPETVDGFDLADLDDLAEAPSHAHDIEQKLMATFPGAKLTVLPEPGEDDTAGGA